MSLAKIQSDFRRAIALIAMHLEQNYSQTEGTFIEARDSVYHYSEAQKRYSHHNRCLQMSVPVVRVKAARNSAIRFVVNQMS